MSPFFRARSANADGLVNPESESSGDQTELKGMTSSNDEIFDFNDNNDEAAEEEDKPERKQEYLPNNQEVRLPKTLPGIKAFLSARCGESITWKNAIIETAGQMSLFSSSTSD